MHDLTVRVLVGIFFLSWAKAAKADKRSQLWLGVWGRFATRPSEPDTPMLAAPPMKESQPEDQVEGLGEIVKDQCMSRTRGTRKTLENE